MRGILRVRSSIARLVPNAGNYRFIVPLKRPISHVFPVNTVAPAVTGIPQSSNVLTCSQGTWTNGVTYGYRWYRDNVPMIAETSPTITVISPWIGSVMFCLVTATSSTGDKTDAVSNSVTIIP